MSDRRRIARWVLRVGTALLCVVCVLISFVAVNIALMWHDSPVSHWKSAEAEQRFMQAYDETMALLPPPEQTRDIPTDLGSVRAYRFVKSGASAQFARQPPLVLLPGHSAPTPMWLPNLEALVQERPVIAIDLLGQPGKSVPTGEVEDSRDQATWLHQVITGLGEERVHLLGVSFGGWTAMNYARYHPERVASASLLDPVLVFAPLRVSAIAATVPTLFPLMPQAYADWFMSWTAGGAPIDASMPEATIIGAGIEEYVVVQPTPEQIPQADLQAIRVPVLAVMAERSVMHDSAKAAQTGRKTVPGIDISVKQGASHAIHGEFADEMNARVLAFAARHD